MLWRRATSSMRRIMSSTAAASSASPGQIFNWSDADIEARVLAIADTLNEIFRRADAEKRPTNEIADTMALERITKGRKAAKAAE